MTDGIELNFHLGDNAGFALGDFANARYVGMQVSLPVRIRRDGASPVTLTINTSAIETLADKQAHIVELNGHLLGHLRDTSGEPQEMFPFELPHTHELKGEPLLLTIRVPGQLPRLEDDFVLRQISVQGGSIVLGWA